MSLHLGASDRKTYRQVLETYISKIDTYLVFVDLVVLLIQLHDFFND